MRSGMLAIIQQMRIVLGCFYPVAWFKTIYHKRFLLDWLRIFIFSGNMHLHRYNIRVKCVCKRTSQIKVIVFFATTYCTKLFWVSTLPTTCSNSCPVCCEQESSCSIQNYITRRIFAGLPQIFRKDALEQAEYSCSYSLLKASLK